MVNSMDYGKAYVSLRKKLRFLQDAATRVPELPLLDMLPEIIEATKPLAPFIMASQYEVSLLHGNNDELLRKMYKQGDAYTLECWDRLVKAVERGKEVFCYGETKKESADA